MSNFFELNFENFRAKSLVEPIGNVHFSSWQESQAPRRASNHREAGKFSYFSITCSGINLAIINNVFFFWGGGVGDEEQCSEIMGI